MVMDNLQALAKCKVTNEADAELALQVSNALTQALLQYRMRNMPVEVLQNFQGKAQAGYLLGKAGPSKQSSESS